MKYGTEANPVRVRLNRRYNDTGCTGRIVEAGTEGEAYCFDAGGGYWKVRVTGQPWGDGEITMRTENLEFLDK
jgi:hypothetical protein